MPPPAALPGGPMHRRHRVARTALLVCADTAMVAASVLIAYLIWAAPMRGQLPGLYLNLAPFVMLFPAGYARMGLYPGLGLGPAEMLRRFSYVTASVFLVLAAFSFALQLPPVYSRVTFGLAFVFSLFLVPVARSVLARATRRLEWWGEPVAIVGTGPAAVRAIRGIRSGRHLGYRAAAVVTLGPDPSAGTSLEGVPIVGGLDQLQRLLGQGIRIAFLDAQHMPPREVLDGLQQAFLHVILLRELEGLPIESLQVRNLGSMVGIEYTNNLLRHRNQTAKRALDLAVGSVALLVLSPLLLMATLAVVIIDGAPVFFYQTRAGLQGRPIRVPKIRTMRRDADERLETHLAADASLRDEWRARYKLRNDPRLIPGIGRLFRRFSVDELPQIWTVITGRMSLVGPRPFPAYHLQQFTPEFRQLRQRVQPGITGLWQVTIRSEGTTEDQESLDTYYIRNWSVWLDLYLLARTVLTVAGGRGAY